MTGASLMSMSGIDEIGQLLSNFDASLPVAGPLLSNSFRTSACRRTPDAAQVISGIRGATPPPAG